MRRPLAVPALAVLASTSPYSACAQGLGAGWVFGGVPELSRSDVAGNRSEPDLEVAPDRFGPFLLASRLAVITGYDGNVFNTPAARSDGVLLLTPEMALSLDDPRRTLALSVSGRLRRFANQESENSEEFRLAGRSGLPITNNLSFALSADLARRIEPRSSSGGALDAREPASYDRISAAPILTFDLGRLQLQAGAGYQRVTFNPLAAGDGGRLSQAFRDMRSHGAKVRLAYDLSGFLSVVASIAGEEHASIRPAQGRERDFREGSVALGLEGEVTPLFHVELALGYQDRNYGNAFYRDFAGASFSVQAEWYCTPLLTTKLVASRAFRNSGNPEVPAILEDTLAISAYYDPTRRLRISGAMEMRWDRYRDVASEARRSRIELQVQYRLDRHVSVSGQLYRTQQDVSGARLVNPYTSLGAGVGIVWTP